MSAVDNSRRRIESLVDDRRGQIGSRRDLDRVAMRAPERRQLDARRRQLGDPDGRASSQARA
jgi:hypothetical protein